MKRNNKGFTLAEMLIVVAIIGILISIVTSAISNSLEKSREAVDLANIRSAYTELYNVTLLGEKMNSKYMYYYNEGSDIKYYVVWIEPTQKKNGWQTDINKDDNGLIVINDAHVVAPNISNDKVYKLIFYTKEKEAKDIYNPTNYYFRVETATRTEFAKKKVQFYNKRTS